MKLANTVFGFTALATTIIAVPTHGSTVDCYGEPDTGSLVVATYAHPSEAAVQCLIDGPADNSTWWRTSDDCYVPESQVNPGRADEFTLCDGANDIERGLYSRAETPANDYPYKSNCGGVDPWNYYKCQCTSFVAWRVNKKLDIKFHNRYKGAKWGNANTWDEAAKKAGVKINSTPKVKSVAVTNAGSAGHVAWVYKVDSKYVWIEEYNWAKKTAYGKRKVEKGTFKYIHV